MQIILDNSADWYTVNWEDPILNNYHMFARKGDEHWEGPQTSLNRVLQQIGIRRIFEDEFDLNATPAETALWAHTSSGAGQWKIVSNFLDTTTITLAPTDYCQVLSKAVTCGQDSDVEVYLTLMQIDATGGLTQIIELVNSGGTKWIRLTITRTGSAIYNFTLTTSDDGGSIAWTHNSVADFNFIRTAAQIEIKHRGVSKGTLVAANDDMYLKLKYINNGASSLTARSKFTYVRIPTSDVTPLYPAPSPIMYKVFDKDLYLPEGYVLRTISANNYWPGAVPDKWKIKIYQNSKLIVDNSYGGIGFSGGYDAVSPGTFTLEIWYTNATSTHRNFNWISLSLFMDEEYIPEVVEVRKLQSENQFGSIRDLEVDSNGDIALTTNDVNFTINWPSQSLTWLLKTAKTEYPFHPDQGVNWPIVMSIPTQRTVTGALTEMLRAISYISSYTINTITVGDTSISIKITVTLAEGSVDELILEIPI